MLASGGVEFSVILLVALPRLDIPVKPTILSIASGEEILALPKSITANNLAEICARPADSIFRDNSRYAIALVLRWLRW